MLTIESAKLTGTPGETGWAQVHDFIPEEQNIKNLRGHLFVVIATSRINTGVETVSIGRHLLGRLHEEYFGDLTTKPFNALKNAVEKVFNEFKLNLGDLEIIASSFVGGVVYSAASGGGKVQICREGAVGTILASEKEGVITSSGFPKAGDMVLLATKTFFDHISQGVIKTALSAGDCESAVETFAPTVRTESDLGHLGVMVLKFKDESYQAVDVALPVATKESFVDVKNKVEGFFKGIIQRLPQKNLYVRPQMDDEVVGQSKKLTFSIALILILILFVSIGFGVRQKGINDLKGKYQSLLTNAQNDVDQAISLASVSPDKSRELFLESEQKLNEILALKVKDPKINDLQNKINTSRAAVLGEYLSSPDLFLDLTLLSSGFRGDLVSASGGNLYVLDKNGRKIVSVAISTKKSKVVAGPTLINEAFDLASYEDRAFVLMSDGIYEVGLQKNKVIDKTWSGDGLIKAFAGNIYVLDKAGNAVYRFAGSGNTFGEKQNWLATGTKADFSDASQWVIDGSVYVRFPNSKIAKFSQGSPQVFSVTSVIPEIGTIDAIYGDADNAGIYLLDRAGKRVVVTDKKGKYVAQYISDQIAGATGLVVSEADKKIILLTGDKLYSIDIRHL